MRYFEDVTRTTNPNDWQRMRLLLVTLAAEVVDMPCDLTRGLLDMAILVARVNCGEEV